MTHLPRSNSPRTDSTPPFPDLPAREGGVGAVVVTYNRKALLEKCLRSLLAQTASLDRIYVVDNASTDGTPDIIPSDDRVTYLRLPQNLGGAYGFARGVELALKGDHTSLWLMDDDCLPEPEALAELLAYGNGVEVRCSAVLARDGRYDLYHRRRFDALRLKEDNLPAREYAVSGATVDLFTFVGPLIPTEVIRRAGLPVDNFFFAYDDFEYALRLRRLGVGARLVPSSRLWHHGSLSCPSPRGPYNPLKHYYNTRNQLLVYREYGTSAPWYVLRFAVKTAGAFIRLMQHRELSVNSARTAAQALYDALRGRAYVRPPPTAAGR
ncbi:glycosyltransferase family 2 protein [Deinococcus sp. YIM 134068]|uniref:glycosyltransferase family 2 protein n=1 Tax=Deinococcus lichenicola TaxID=3118910 RepID=UPI002F954982